MNLKSFFLPALAFAAGTFAAAAADNCLTVRTDRPGAEIRPTMYGLFFEDINYGADGGLYAEMVKNRSFEFPQHLMGWYTFGNVAVRQGDGPFERNPHYVRLGASGHDHKHTGLENEGFFGVTVRKGEKYRFSVWARTVGAKNAKLRVELVDPASGRESQAVATAVVEVASPQWSKYTAELTPDESVARGKLRIFLQKPDADATVYLEHVSLFPVDTWQGHENGLRRDLAQALYDLHPGVFRFPGGCIVEGTDLADRYQWKNTVGPVENRPLNLNRWHYTFTHRFYPDYYQSYGLGFYEYFLLSEEIGAEPLPVINVCLVCQYQNDKEEAHVPVDSLAPYIDDALDLIEFANGAVDTEWGALRAQMGHPEPFNLKFLAVGNEQWGSEYVERLKPFVEALRKAHPEIKIVGSSGPSPEGEEFDYLWPQMKSVGADLVDEHYYRPEDWFAANATRYDSYDRRGPKVFAGEYACHGRGRKFNHFNAALMEAALMTGLERNADVVHMATYAPLFAHVEGWQWRPDMIWFDNDTMSVTSTYYVQQLYAVNKGERVLPLTMDGLVVAGLDGQNGLYASAVVDNGGRDYVVKVVNAGKDAQTVCIDLAKLKKNGVPTSLDVASLTCAEGDEYALEGTNLECHAVPAVRTVAGDELARSVVEAKGSWKYSTEVPAESFTVFRFKVQ